MVLAFHYIVDYEMSASTACLRRNMNACDCLIALRRYKFSADASSLAGLHDSIGWLAGSSLLPPDDNLFVAFARVKTMNFAVPIISGMRRPRHNLSLHFRGIFILSARPDSASCGCFLLVFFYSYTSHLVAINDGGGHDENIEHHRNKVIAEIATLFDGSCRTKARRVLVTPMSSYSGHRRDVVTLEARAR